MVTPEQRSTQSSEHADACELLFELYVGATGPVHLGRLLRGKHAGRLVMLRPVSAAHGVRAKALVDRVRNISHPKLLKLLGCFRIGSQDYLASEYIAGASFVELRSKLALTSSKDVAVMVRIARDVLLAAHSGRRLLHGIYGRKVDRCIFPDTIWIAEFGEVFITELAVFEAMVGDPALSVVRTPSSLETEDASGRADILSIGQILFDAIGNRSKKGEALFGLPIQTEKALTKVMARALEHEGETPFEGAIEMVHALSNLPSGLNASTDDVRGVLRQALQVTLELRRQKLKLVEQASVVSGDDDKTQFHRASGLNHAGDLDTMRPSVPTGSGTRPTAKATAPAIPALKLPASAAKRGGDQKAFRSTTQRSEVAPNDIPTVRPPPECEAATVVFRLPVDSDAATSVWVPDAARNAAAMDEDATTFYVASKERPAEPSVIIQDHDASDLYLRARTEVSRVRGVSADDPTRISQRPKDNRDPMSADQRRRRWLGAALFVVILLLTAALTIFVSRGGAF